jgi:DNA primase
MDVLDSVLEQLDYARQYSTYISGLCPFHEDTRPSLIVHEDNYVCLACGAKGRTVDLLDVLSSNTFAPVPKQVSSFQNPFTQWTKNTTLEHAIHIANSNLPCIYLRDRCISVKVQQQLHLGYRDNWVTFPIYDKSHSIIGAVARAAEGNKADSKYVTPAGQDANMLYVPNWDLLNSKDYIVCVFGIIDTVSLYSLGVPSFSTTGGKRLDSETLDGFRKRIIFWPDRGEEIDAQRISCKLGWRGKVQSLDYPYNCKDINDLLQHRPELLKLWVSQL